MSTQVFKMFAPLPATYLPEVRRQIWGRLFGLSIRAARTEAGMSIEEAAGLSGMQVSEWMAIEDGHVPQEINRLRAMAAALEINFEKLMNMVLLCREAWEL
jgi:transcriptional regulator with XRE-family HTH domain